MSMPGIPTVNEFLVGFETSAFAGSLGGEERFEDVIERGTVDAGAVVGDGKQNVAAGFVESVFGAEAGVELDVAGFDDHFAAVGHGVAGVEAEIEQDLMHLRGIAEDGPGLLRDRNVRGQVLTPV